MTKKTFNLTDLTKAVYGNEDTNSSIFQANRKKVENHFKEIRKMLGHTPEKLEVPIIQLEPYVYLIKNLLENPEYDEALNVFKKKLSKNKPLNGVADEDALKTLIEILAESAGQTLSDEDRELYKKFVQDRISDDYYIASKKNTDEVMQIVNNDFLLFNGLSSLSSKLDIQEQYMDAIRKISFNYSLAVTEHIFFRECILEVLSSSPHSDKKLIYTETDFLQLPLHIQEEIQKLIEKKMKEAL